MLPRASANPPAAPFDATTEPPTIDALLAGLQARAGATSDEGDRALLASAASTIARLAEARQAAERRLAEREQQIDLIEQLAGLGSWEIDLATDRIRWSREQRRIHGVDAEHAPATHTAFMAMVHADDRHIIDAGMAELESRDRVTVEFRVVRPDGEVRLLQARGQLVRDAEGRPLRVIGTSLDVTNRRTTEQALRASEESYRAIFQGASDAMFLHDMETGAILEVNGVACELSGHTAEDLKAIGLDGLTDAAAGYTVDRAWEYARRALGGEPQRFEWLTRHKDGHPVWVEMTLRLVKIRGVDRILAIARGIDDRKAAEAALRASEESYRTIFQHASDAMWLHDVDTGAFLEVNNEAVALLGYTAEEQKRVGMPGISTGEAPYTIAYGFAKLKLAAAGEPQRFEWPCRHKDGHTVWSEVRLRRVTIGGVERILAAGRDISDRKQAEAALRHAYGELEHRVAERTAELAASREALLARTRELEGVFQALPDLYVRITADGTILDARGARIDALSVPPAELVGRRLRTLLPDEVCDRFNDVLAAAAPGALATAEYQLAEGDAICDYEARFFPLGDGTRICLVRDITERKEAERALRDREEYFRRLIENSSDQVMVFDATGAITYTGPSCERILGYTAEEMLGLRPDAIVHPDDLPLVWARIAYLASRPGETLTTEYRVRHKNGQYRVLEAVGRTLSNDGPEAGIVANCRDITERKDVERALRERDEHFRRVIENASDFVMMIDSTAAITYVAPSVTQMLGFEQHEMMGLRPDACVHPDDIPHVLQDFHWIITHPGEPYTSTFRIRHKDGSYRVFENRGRTLSSHTAAEGVVAFGRDITERTQAEAALARAKEEAERANAAKSEFLSRMSHELRTPMNSILGFGQLLARAELPPQHAKGVQHIVKAGRHLLHLINEVLEIARIEAGRESFSLEPVALGSVMQEAIGLVRPLAQQHGVVLHDAPAVATSRPMPESACRDALRRDDVCVVADRRRLVQVLLNLLSNAIKYNRPGGSVRLACAPNATDGWAIRVEDTGHGIPADRVDQLFTPFARLGAEQTDVEGTGLGLALSKRLCEAMGGALVLASSGAEGSVFRVDLSGAPHPLERFEDTGARPAVGSEGGEATLLYVEDNLANLTLVEAILLSRPGWRIIPALQGQLGVELAREHRPDVVLLDLHLPDIPGVEVLRRLRADPRTAAIPTVVVSADATTVSLERLRQAGADAYLTKPLDVDEFLTVVQRHLPAAARRGR